jgi:hypothetical protein
MLLILFMKESIMVVYSLRNVTKAGVNGARTTSMLNPGITKSGKINHRRGTSYSH